MESEVMKMAAMHYTAKVKDSRILELPEEARDLGLQPGEEVIVSVDRIENASIAPNEKMLSILRGIQERHKDRPYTDGSDTQRLIREARAGAKG
jgi:hypothetical protein